MQVNYGTSASTGRHYNSKNYEDIQKRLAELKLGGRYSEQPTHYSGNKGSTYDRSGLYSSKLLSATAYSRQSYSSDQPFNHVSIRPSNLPTLENIKEIKTKPMTLTVSEAFTRDTLRVSNRTTSRCTDGMSPGAKYHIKYVESKQQDVSVSWLSETENFEEYVEVDAEQLLTREAVKGDTSVEESVILFSARGCEDKESFVVSEFDGGDMKSLLGSFVDTRNAVYVFNTNSSIKP